MPAVESQMLPLGTQAPTFTLPDPDGTLHSLRDDAPATLVMFISNHCPFVIHVRAELEAVLASETPAAEQTPSIGCSIKWASGNEPEYS